MNEVYNWLFNRCHRDASGDDGFDNLCTGLGIEFRLTL